MSSLASVTSSGESSPRRLQLGAQGEGSEHKNTYCLSFKKMKLGDGRGFPSEIQLNNFLRECLSLDVSKIHSVNHSRFPGTGICVDGYRVDKKYVTARLTGVPPWVEKSDIDYLFERWGKVISIMRGTSSLSLPCGEVGVWGSGWVWDGEWVVRLQQNHGENSIPTCISACGDVWQVWYKGAPTVRFRCGDTKHLFTTCRATEREGMKTSRWDPTMGFSSEVFFPTKQLKGMSEEVFSKKQKANIEKGNKVGVRISSSELKEDEELSNECDEDGEIHIQDLKKKVEVAEETIFKMKEKYEDYEKLEAKFKMLEEKSISDNNFFQEKVRKWGDVKIQLRKHFDFKDKEITRLKETLFTSLCTLFIDWDIRHLTSDIFRMSSNQYLIFICMHAGLQAIY